MTTSPLVVLFPLSRLLPARVGEYTPGGRVTVSPLTSLCSCRCRGPCGACLSRGVGVVCGCGAVLGCAPWVGSRGFLPRPRDCVRLAARVKVDAGWTFGPRGALHLDSLRFDGAPGGCRGRALCGPALRAVPQASGPPGPALSPTRRVCAYPISAAPWWPFHRVWKTRELAVVP